MTHLLQFPDTEKLFWKTIPAKKHSGGWHTQKKKTYPLDAQQINSHNNLKSPYVQIYVIKSVTVNLPVPMHAAQAELIWPDLTTPRKKSQIHVTNNRMWVH